MSPEVADVAIVGFGPTGGTLAGLLASRGREVVVVDRELGVFPLPRAAQCDHEAIRILQELGIAEEILAGCITNEGIALVNGHGDQLLKVDAPAMAPSGWPTSSFFHQPIFDAAIRRRAVELGAEVRLGAEVVDVRDAEGVGVLELADGTELRGRYVVGCDGARSLTREAIGAVMDDSGFEESWLVVDLLLEEHQAGLPARCIQVCDPARPHTLVPMPGARFRFEFMLLPGEEPEALATPESVHGLIEGWLPPEQATIERSAVYTFHGVVADRWRAGRLLIAGDAAHQTPPFLGQGMCAGLRDAANLAWKLDAVLSGADPSLLDTYEGERSPHAAAVIDAAVTVGQIICTTDVELAAARDAAMLAGPGGGLDADFIPPLGPGRLVGEGGGALSAQPVVDGRRLDDLVGSRFCLVTATPAELDGELGRWWGEQGLVLDATAHPELGCLLDGADACVLRPDRYVMAAGPVDAVAALAPAAIGLRSP